MPVLLAAGLAGFAWHQHRDRQHRRDVAEAQALGWHWTELGRLERIRRLVSAALRRGPWTRDSSRLTIDDAPSIAAHPDLARRLDPQRLRIHDLSDWTDLAGLPDLPDVRALSLGSGRSITRLDGIERLANLRVLHAPGREHLRDIRALSSLVHLEELRLSLPQDMRDLSALGPLHRLRMLELLHGKGLADLTALGGLRRLQSLSFADMDAFPNPDPLAGLPELDTLVFDGIRDPSRLLSFPAIPSLRVVYLNARDHPEDRLLEAIRRANPDAVIHVLP